MSDAMINKIYMLNKNVLPFLKMIHVHYSRNNKNIDLPTAFDIQGAQSHNYNGIHKTGSDVSLVQKSSVIKRITIVELFFK